MKNKSIIIIGISLLFLALCSFSIKNINNDFVVPTHYSHATYAYDMSTPEKAIGATNYTFVGKVLSKKSTEYRNPIEIEVTPNGDETRIVYDPYTIYNVKVIKNIKGNLIENIELVEFGGYSNEENAYIYLDNMSSLEEEHYYIFMAFAVENNGELQITSPYSYIDLNIESENDLLNNTQYGIYENAYNNQIIPEGYNDLKSKYDSK